jgi:hypothetical protein
MMVFAVQEAADLCGIPYRTIMNYAERWPWLVYRDKDREINPDPSGPPRAYVPRGTTTILALIRHAYECGQSTEQVTQILAALPEGMVPDGDVGNYQLVFYPATGRTQRINLDAVEDKLAGKETWRDSRAAELRAENREAEASEVEKHPLPSAGELSIILPMGALQEQLHAQEAAAGICPRNLPIDLSNRIAATLRAQYHGGPSVEKEVCDRG